MDFLIAIALFILLSAIITFIIKKKTKFDTFFLITLIKVQKPIEIMKNLSKKMAFMDFLSEIFVLLGFGAIGADFLYGKGKPMGKRLTILAASFVILSIFMYLLDLFLGQVFSMAPLTKPYFSVLVFVFGISGFSGFILFSMALQGLDIIEKMFEGKQACPGVAPMLPGVKLPNVPVVIPVHAWLSLFIILIIHEAMHGIVAIRNKLKIKSTGIVLFGFLPIAAFVEPDDKDLEKMENEKPKAALKFLSAGPGANLLAMPFVYVLIILFALGAALAFSPWQGMIKENHPEQIFVDSVDQNLEFCGDVFPSPAYGLVDANWQIIGVNGKDVNSLALLQSELSKNRFKEVAFKFRKIDGNIVDLSLKPNEMGTFGLSILSTPKDADKIPESYKTASSIVAFIMDFLSWLFLLNFLMAIANFLPMSPFDGGRMAAIILASYLPFGKDIAEKKALAGKILFWSVIVIITVNILPLFT